MQGQEDQYKRCIACGAQIYKEAVMCPQCGTMLPVQQRLRRTKASKTNGFLLAACVIASLDLIGTIAMLGQVRTNADIWWGYGPFIFFGLMAIAVAALWASFITKSRTGVFWGAVTLCLSPIGYPLFLPYMIFPAIFVWIGYSKIPKDCTCEPLDKEKGYHNFL